MKEYCRCVRAYIEKYEEYGCTRAGNVRQKLFEAVTDDQHLAHLPSIKALVVIETVVFALWEFDKALPAPDWNTNAAEPFSHAHFVETLRGV